MKLSPTTTSILRVCITALVIELVFFAGYRYWELLEQNTVLIKKSAGLEAALHATEEGLWYVKKENAILRDALSAAQIQNQILGTQVTGLAGAVGDLSGTVGVIQKLRATDPELLKKYSKVYFLSENYIPSQLLGVDARYLAESTTDEYLHARALPFLHRMLAAAQNDNVTLQVVSAYRSFDEQSSVKSGYKVLYGSGANQFSAEQGYSEHQLGTTCDFTTPSMKTLSLQFETSSAYKWLITNAHKFGFVLSYPKHNAYYQFEPWHWRFVGVALATTLHDQNKYFYELTQREIDEHLINFFD